MTRSLSAAALDYTERGWPVLPLHWPARIGDTPICSCPRGLHCESSPAKHPLTPNGLDDATTDHDTVAGWWRRWPRANIGLRTGIGFDVLDIDDDTDLARLVLEHGDIALEGPTVATGHGHHLYVAPIGNGNRARFLPGCDWRGRRGYVVAPPSVHMTGQPYRWLESGPDTPILPAPPWLADLVLSKDTITNTSVRTTPTPTNGNVGAYARAALDDEADRVARAVEGCRNDTLNRASYDLGQLVVVGYLTARVAGEALLDAALAAGLGETEAVATIRSGLRAGVRAPRSA